MRLTHTDAGHEVFVRAGERLEVALPEIPTSGYVWTVHRADPAYLALEGEEYLEPDKDLPRVGTRKTKLFIFRALKEGRTEVELWLRRPWEDADKHLESYEVTLKILSR